MEEIRPGLLHWTAFHEGIRQQVHSAFHVPTRTLIDPMAPSEGAAALDPARIVLTNRHHYRHSDRFREASGCPVLCHEAGLHEFEGGPQVDGFAWGDEVAPGVTALEVGILCPEESALHIADGGGALAFADAVIRGRAGRLAFVPDFLLGDDPEAIKEGLRVAFLRLCEEREFDTLLMAHGDPEVAGGRAALRAFADVETAA
jgi:hypothetical protein